MSEWISVKDRLPNPTDEVIAFSPKYKEYLMGKVCEQEDYVICEFEEYMLTKVTHWMPFPEPPKEDDA